MRRRYLFIRLLEACNARCFMCGFAQSRDSYRFGVSELQALLGQPAAADIGYVRFTGGEPLIHRDILALVATAAAAGARPSLITNGALLPRKIAALAAAGLDQVVVSLDGADSASHDTIRATPGLFARAVAGLDAARRRGLYCRVNTVAGPHNYRQLPALRDLLATLGVEQWEVSALKLAPHQPYDDPDHVRALCEPLYHGPGPRPLGKRFYGDDAAEQHAYFAQGLPPRPSLPLCHLAGDVVYVDAKAGRGFACSLLPHREADESAGGVDLRDGALWRLDPPDWAGHVARFRRAGPSHCTGCSATAAGYSDDRARGAPLTPWSF